MNIGDKNGRLTLISTFIQGKYSKGIFSCECGTISEKYISHVTSGFTKSCGCIRREVSRKKELTHGKTNTAEFTTWQGMRSRCYNLNSTKYKNYGGRGIIICDRWRNSFENFLEDMGEKPTPKHSIDRIRVNGNYEKSNCRWATIIEQMRNTTRNHWIEYEGRIMVLSAWVEELRISSSRVRFLLNKGKTFDYIYKRYRNKDLFLEYANQL